MKGDFRILSVDWTARWEDLAALRREVFAREQGIPESLLLDESDAVSRHWVAEDKHGVVIAGARLLPNSQIGRVAVRLSWRRKGVGLALMQAVLAAARARGDEAVHLEAQCHSIPFYERLGFVQTAPVTEVVGILHGEMRLEF